MFIGGLASGVWVVGRSGFRGQEFGGSMAPTESLKKVDSFLDMISIGVCFAGSQVECGSSGGLVLGGPALGGSNLELQ